MSVVTTSAAIAAAYAITRLRFRGRGPTMALVLTAQLVPGLVVLVPLVVVMRQLGLADSLVGLGIAHLTLGLPIAVMLLRNYLADIPKSLQEAAMIDGCSVLERCGTTSAAETGDRGGHRILVHPVLG